MASFQATAVPESVDRSGFALSPSPGRALRNSLFTFGGVTCVGVAVVGIALPGIPTTGPLLLASFLLAKGNPSLQRWLLRCPLFRRYFEYLDGCTVMPMKARCWATAWMWASIAASSIFLLATGSGGPAIVTACFAAGLVGTVVIFRFRRDRSH
jgi:hypothetical protein